MQKERYHSPDREIIDLLQDMDPERLRLFAARYTAWNSEFKKDLISHFRPPERNTLIEFYRKEADACFMSHGRYRRNYDYYEAAYVAEQALSGMLEKAEYLISQNNYMEASAIAQGIIEVIPRHYEEVDDSGGGLGMVFSDATTLLQTIVESEKAGQELKKEIFHWLAKEVKEDVYYV